MPIIKCRPANADDTDLLFSWVNDVKVRKNSFSTDKISYQEHIDWFSKILSDNSVEIYIYYLDNEPIGQVRLNYSENEVLVSYSIAQKYRGQGFGKYIIHDIEKIISEKHPDATLILAKVKAENIASQKIFEDNHYTEISNDGNVLSYSKKIKIENIIADISEDINTYRERERERERESLTAHQQQKRTEII